MTFPKLSSLVWPSFVALSLIGLFCVNVYLVKDNTQIKADNAALKTTLEQLKSQVSIVQSTNNLNTVLYSGGKKSDQNLIKNAARQDLLFKKPGLIENKINDSFNKYMQDFDK